MTTKTTKSHPYDFLDDRITLSEAQVKELEANASSVTNHEGISVAIYRFDGLEFNSQDKKVWVNLLDNSWTIPKSDDCTCEGERSVLNCHCFRLPCPECQESFTAWEIICEFDLSCLNDGCNHCRHCRTECGRATILKVIQEAYEATDAVRNTQAERLHEALAAFHSGVDPARFEVTDNYLDNAGKRNTDGQQPSWTMPDGSILASSRNGLWYEL